MEVQALQEHVSNVLQSGVNYYLAARHCLRAIDRSPIGKHAPWSQSNSSTLLRLWVGEIITEAVLVELK